MKTVHIYGSQEVINLGGRIPDDEWSEDSTKSSWEIAGIGVDVPDQYISLDNAETSHIGDVFALVVISSNGDSFSYHENSEIEIVWVFNDEELAKTAAKQIQEHTDWYETAGRHGINTDEGFTDSYYLDIDIGEESPMRIHTYWNGYFESLSEALIVKGTL